jgi:LAO/AO transport system kinase
MNKSDVFMRSIASRGALGGISRSLRNIVRILDAAGYDLIIVESVGAGQLEIEVSKVVNLTLVVFTPNTGDKVQAVKAGITEIGDIYIVNKADLEGANTLYNTIRDFIGETERKPIILKCSAKTGTGIREVAETIRNMLNEYIDKFKEKDQELLKTELRDMVLNILKDKIIRMLNDHPTYHNYIDKIQNKKMDPFQAAEEITTYLLKNAFSNYIEKKKKFRR